MERLYANQEMNVLLHAIKECAKDTYGNAGEKLIYLYLEETPKTSLVAEIVDKLNELGYHIVKSNT